MIRIQGLHKFFNKGRQNEIHVINDVSLDLPEKGMVAIFGKSGCGKTTLLNVIGGLDGFAQGELTIEGQSIKQDTDVIRNRYIGYIFQNYNLNKQESCYDNIADALRLCGMTNAAEIETRVMAALTNVGMEKYAKRLPDTLSGGQQQRIAIARAIVKNPRIILADEPTGNLDEANTVMIMDLLKAISKDHLVLLVTHEANLVDYYCDTVIELSDGKVVNVKTNASANGFAARDKNDIYLGELAKTELKNANAEISYYGEPLATPIKLTVVNHGGKLYLQLGSEQVQILDAFSEVKLREGVYKENPKHNDISRSIDMSSLPPVQGTRFGRLFSLLPSVKSGYRENFKHGKRGKKMLRSCMSLFAAVVVFMSAVFGTTIGDIIDIQNAYNHNVFYLYTPDAAASEKLNAAVGSDASGIDYIRLSSAYPSGDDWAFFRTGSFETFEQYDYESNFKTNAVYLDVSLAKDMKLVEGKKEGLATEEILISTRVADALLEKSTLGYITERSDLIGLLSNMFTIDGKSPRIAGIVDSDEPAIYLTELGMAKYVRYGVSPSKTSLGSDYGITVNEGETVLAIRQEDDSVKYPKVGEKIQIQGRTLTVTSIKRAYYDYNEWLKANGIQKLSDYDYFKKLTETEHPELDPGTDAFYQTLDQTMFDRYYEYYDYLYTEADAYYRDYLFFEPYNLEIWMYLEKGVEEARFIFLPEDYYKATVYRERYGRYPTQDELSQMSESLPGVYDNLKQYYMAYEDEFYMNQSASNISTAVYLVSESDYVAFSKQLGETHPSAVNNSYGLSYYKEVDIGYIGSDAIVDMEYYTQTYYTVIHSTDPAKTEAWLEAEFTDLSLPVNGYMPALVTPNTIFDDLISDSTKEIVAGLITMAVILVLMSICMYFIMRSSLMNRVKEVGIYRAIGVSKKNLVFKFFIEALVLATLTVFVGYLITSAFLFICLGISSMVAEIFFYPVWMALAVLVILYVLSLFCGTLPILSLLRKTPSEILAKYDI